MAKAGRKEGGWSKKNLEKLLKLNEELKKNEQPKQNNKHDKSSLPKP
jgi:hypothetical protein